MSHYVIDVSVASAAPPRDVFALLSDGATWPRWGTWTRFTLEQPGADSAQGPGAIRVFTSRTAGRTVFARERVLELVPDRRLGYELLSGLPLRNYLASVDLEPDGAGCTIRWRAGFDGAPFGTGGFYRRVLTSFLRDAAGRVGQYALQHPAAR
jgi:hypothetical protein